MNKIFTNFLIIISAFVAFISSAHSIPITYASAVKNLPTPQTVKFTAASAAKPNHFYVGSSFTTQPGPAVLASGDIDGDGDLDVVSCSIGSTDIGVQLNDGSGNFSQTTVAIGISSRYVELADLDGDGDLDMLTATSDFPGTVSVHFNNGSGSFSGRTDYLPSAPPLSLRTGDLDGDGDLDLAIAIQTGVEIRLNNGSGNFGAGIYAVALARAFSVLLEDVDSDGDLDIIANTQDYTLTVRLNNGSGTFSGTDLYTSNRGALAAGDVDNDGDIDFVNGSQGSGIIYLFRNDGTGTLTGSAITNAPSSTMHLILGDTDGDGDLDLIVGDNTIGTAFLVLPNDGTGSFGAPASFGGSGYALAKGDWDGDGDLDAMLADVAGGGGTSIYVMINGYNVNLTSLTLSSGTLSPVFASGTTSYTASVGNSTSSITLTPTVADATSTVTINGTTVTSGSASSSIPLSVGNNTITTVVTALDGTTTSTYTVVVTRAPSNNANLTNLALSSGTLSPVFASGTTAYTTSVGNATSSITITPTVSDATATVTVNGTNVTSGSASASIPLVVGSNTITTVVTAQDGSTTKTYTVTVTRAPSANANLGGLVLSSGTVSPAFASGTTSYTTSVSNATSTITITPKASDATATLTVNGTVVASGSASTSIPLVVGSNTITTVITAQDGSTTQTYTVTVTRAKADQTISFAALPAATYGDASFTLTGTASSGLPVTYISSNTSVATVAGNTLTILKAGTTTITASQAGNATYNSASDVSHIFTINPAPPTDITLAQQTLLENSPAGTLVDILTSTSADPSATYTYTLVAGTGSADNTSFSISGNQLLTAQTLDYETKSSYNIRIRTTNNYNQSLDKTFVITLKDVNEAPTLAAISDQNICANANSQTLSLSGISPGPETGQTVTLSVNSSNNNLFEELTVNSNTVTYRLKNNASGNATITVTVLDNGDTANSGVNTFSRSFVLSVLQLPQLSVISAGGTSLSKGATLQLTASGASAYSWADSEGIISGQNSATLNIRPSKTTTYTVTGTTSGCSSTASITITVIDDYNLIANNVLTPNGDGRNDLLAFSNIDMYPDNELKIFDRAGRVLYVKKGYNNEWDGKYNGTTLAEDTYYYVIDFDKGANRKKGYLSIIIKQ